MCSGCRARVTLQTAVEGTNKINVCGLSGNMRQCLQVTRQRETFQSLVNERTESQGTWVAEELDMFQTLVARDMFEDCMAT